MSTLFGFGIFDPARGGDPVLFQHLFWFYSHPAVYIMVLPAMGVISEVVATFSRKNVFGYEMIAYSSLGIAFVGFFVWGHHMFVSGQSTFDAGVFGVLSMLVGVFTAIKVFNWVGTLYKGAVDFTTPFAYFCGFLFFTRVRRHDRRRGGHGRRSTCTGTTPTSWSRTSTSSWWARRSWPSWPRSTTGSRRCSGRMYPEGWGLVVRGAHHPGLQRHVHPAVPARATWACRGATTSTRSGSRR